MSATLCTTPLEELRSRYTAKQVADARARALRGLRYQGPWCSNCGKRGRNCRDRTACNLRKIRAMPRPVEGASLLMYEYHETRVKYGLPSAGFYSRETVEAGRRRAYAEARP